MAYYVGNEDSYLCQMRTALAYPIEYEQVFSAYES